MAFKYSLLDTAKQLIESGDEVSLQKCHQMLEMHAYNNICSDTKEDDLMFERLCKYIFEHKKLIALTNVNIRKNELEYAINKIEAAKENMENILEITKKLYEIN